MILLASRTATVRRRWRAGLKGVAVQEVADRRRLDALVSERAPVIVILDSGMLGTRGVAEVASLQRLSPASRFIVAAAQPTEREGIAAFRAGARGYCHRDLDPALLAKAVEVVQKGEIWAGRTLVARLIEELGARVRTHPRTDSSARVGGLTTREREIAGLVSGGASNKEIAARLGVTERTVKAHLTAIFRKIGVTDRLRLALYLNGAVSGDEGRLAPKSNLRTAPARDE